MSNAPIRICFVDARLDAAESLVSLLRNAGMAIRPSQVDDPDELARLIASEPFDLVVVSEPGPVSLADVAAEVARAGKDLSIIALLREMDVEQRAAAFEAGATAVEPRHPPLVVAAVKRQFDQLRARRELRRLEGALRESERRCDGLLDSSRDPIAFVHEGMHIRANRAYLEMFGFDEDDDIEGQPLLDLIAASDTDQFKRELRRMSKGEDPPEYLELNLRRSDGHSFPGRMEFSNATYAGEACIQLVIRNPQEDPALAAELTRLKERDLVTDLYNRTHLTTLLERTSVEAASGKRNHALLLLDIDEFASVINAVGVGHGDLLLADIAKALGTILEPDDIAARFGDHSFAILTPTPTLDAAGKLADRVRERISDHIFEIGQASVSITFSIGGVLICERLHQVPAILAQASNACTTAQAEGGNRMVLHDPYAEEKAEANRNAHWVKLVEDALARDDGFVLFYQPMVGLQGAEGEHFEVLLRMNSPRSEILPSFFMPAAQQAGLMARIDRWVIASALAELARSGKRPPTFFVTLSTDTLEDPTFAGWLAEQLKSHRVSGERLVLQVAENEASVQLKSLQTLFKHLSGLRVGVTISNFGAGLTSFQLLKHVPAQYLKIDHNYIADFAGNAESQKKVQEICDQARAGGMKTIAPQVTDMASVSVLYQCGVNFVQGDFLHEPARSTLTTAA